MTVITVSRQFGAGGSDVAQRVAAALGWTLIDNDFVERVAAQAGLPAETVAAQEERAPSLAQRLVRALATASPETFVPGGAQEELDEQSLVRVTERVIAEAKAAGRVVLVGRGAAYLASSATDALHVYVVAAWGARVRAVMARQGVDEKAADQAIRQTDADRDRYVEAHYKHSRQDPANYHLTVNTDLLGYDGAADLVIAAVRQRGWNLTT